MRALLLNLAYSNIWIALSAAGEVLVNQALLGLPCQLLGPCLAFAIMFMVYTFAKAIHFDPKADCLNDPERTAFLLRWRWHLSSAALALYLVALAIAHSRGLAFWCLFPFLTALAYDIKFLPKRFRYRRLKDVPGVKSGVVAATWAVTTVWLPVLLSGSRPSGTAVVLLWNFLIWFVNTVFFDLGDTEGDRLEGTLTLPLVMGFHPCRRLLLATSLAAAACLWWAQQQGLVSSWAAWANLVSLYSFAYVLAARSEDQDLGFLCDVVADGMYVVGALILWLRLSL